MFTQYFGNYLFESDIITLEQFKVALQQINDKHAKFGVLAIEAGLMTPEQVEKTHAIQLQVNKRFGEIAIENGYITDEQLEDLLSRQSSPFLIFSQILIDQGYITYAQLSENLDGYRKKCGLSEENFTRFKGGDIIPVIENLVLNKFGDKQKELIVISYVEIFIKNIMRFINDNVTLGEIEHDALVDGGLVTCQKMTGTRNIITSYTGSEEALRYFSSRFAKKEFSELGDKPRDVLGEFLNCCNGIFSSNIVEYNIDLELEPQFVTNDKKLIQSEDMIGIPFSIDNYSYQLLMAF